MNHETHKDTIAKSNENLEKQKQHSQAFLRKRKMLMVMPLLVIPFLTMAFWALGGGKGDQNISTSQTEGLNLNLPDAKLENDDLTDKLSFYEKADKDSVKMDEWMRNDPYYKGVRDTPQLPYNDLEQLTQSTASRYSQQLNTSPYEVVDNNPEQQIMAKLSMLEKEINKQPQTNGAEPSEKDMAAKDDELSSEVDRLENLMQQMTQTGNEDPEMEQLNGTLEKILDIQHPDRVKEKLREKSMKQKEVVFAVGKNPINVSVSLLDTIKKKAKSAFDFYGIESSTPFMKNEPGIEAVVHASQVLVNGAVIKLRLTTDIYLNGTMIPKGQCVFGIASLNDERLEIVINSIRNGNALFPVKLEVFDMDGLPGIYIPGAISREVAKQSADNSLQLMELASMDPSLKAQATAAGLSTVKTMLSRKVKQVKVLVKAGYKVLLLDKNIQP